MQQTTTISMPGTASHQGGPTGTTAMPTATARTATGMATGAADAAGHTHTGQATTTQAAHHSTSSSLPPEPGPKPAQPQQRPAAVPHLFIAAA